MLNQNTLMNRFISDRSGPDRSPAGPLSFTAISIRLCQASRKAPQHIQIKNRALQTPRTGLSPVDERIPTTPLTATAAQTILTYSLISHYNDHRYWLLLKGSARNRAILKHLETRLAFFISLFSVLVEVRYS
jgi:hypothetical protein